MRAVEGLVDGLHSNAVSVLVVEFVRDLLGTPALVEVVLHKRPQLGVGLKATRLGSGPPTQHQLMRCMWLVVALHLVSFQLPAHSRHSSAQSLGDRARRSPGADPISNRDPFVLAQITARLSWRWSLIDDRLNDPRDPITRDHPTVLPPMPSLAIDPQLPTRRRVRHALTNQPHIQLLLLDHRLSTGTATGTVLHCYSLHHA